MAKKKKVIDPMISAYMAKISGKGKGGVARAKNLSPERLSEIGKKASEARWSKNPASAKSKAALPEEALEFFREHGRKGGKLGGPARMAKLTPERRSEIAKNAVAAREAKRAEKRKT